MIPLVTTKQTAIAALCRRYGVARLDLFGSAATGQFDAAHSDLDFVAEFVDAEPTTAYADRFLDFADALESLLGCHVDVVSEGALNHSRLARAIAATRQTVYAAPQPVAV